MKLQVDKVCRGIYKVVGGFRWVYRKDYEQQLKQVA